MLERSLIASSQDKTGFHWEYSIHDTLQQLGVAEQLDQLIAEGIMTALLQSGLGRNWWEDATTHWLHGKICILLSVIAPLTLSSYSMANASTLQPFRCLAYMHLQKDQRPALTPHADQCIFIGYPPNYKGWKFWCP